MTAPDDLARTLAELMRSEGWDVHATRTSHDGSVMPMAFEELLASVVSRRDTDLQAQAWDEGYKARASLTRPMPDWRDFNPYRSDAKEGAS